MAVDGFASAAAWTPVVPAVHSGPTGRPTACAQPFAVRKCLIHWQPFELSPTKGVLIYY